MSKTGIGRRNAIGKISFAGVALLAGSRCGDGTTTGPEESTGTTGSSTSSNPACVLTPALTEGPFYFDAGQIRRDITEGRPGTPLRLALEVVNASSCRAIRDAVVDIWHCDAVMATSPYDQSGSRDTRNSTDSIFTSATVADVAADGGGYAASLVIGVSA